MSLNNNYHNPIQEDLNILLKYRNNRRTQDQIIADIIKILQNTRKEILIPFVLQMITMID